jgi:hypothetical protein
MFIGLLSSLVCVGFIDSFKELSKLSYHFSQFANILLCFFEGYLRWLARIESCVDTEFMSKLVAGILQRSNECVGFFPKDWDMSAILIFAVTSFIVTDRGGSLVVLYT